MAFPSQPPNWVDGQQALINGVTYVYSLANGSWSPLSSSNTLTYPSITAVTSNISGTETVGTSVVTGNETVQGNEIVTGTLTAGSIVSASIIKRQGGLGDIDLNSSTYFIGTQVVGYNTATNRPGYPYGVMLNIQERSDTAGQLVIDYNNGNLYTRGIYVPSSVSSGNTPSFSGWNTVLHNNNYNNYSPTITGGNASGTWAINITGSAGSSNNAATTNGIGSTNFSSGSLVYSSIQQGGRNYEAHDFNSYPNLYSTVFINSGTSSNVPSGFSGMGYRFIMGAGDTGTRGFDLVGSSEPSLWFRERSEGSWNKVISNNQPAFHATSSNSPSTGMEWVFNGIAFNRGNRYNASSGRFTAPVAGVYFFYVFGLPGNGDVSDIRISLRVNATTYSGDRFILTKSFNSWQTVRGESVMYLSAGDWVSPWIDQSSGGFHTDAGYTGFGGYLIG